MPEQDGVAVLPAKLASDIARSFGSGAINVEVTDDVAQMSFGRSDFSLRLMHADEYPRFEPPTATDQVAAVDRHRPAEASYVAALGAALEGGGRAGASAPD